MARICSYPGCTNTTHGRYCQRHEGTPVRADRNRGNSGERGYDHRWRKLRVAFIREWMREKGPYCAACGKMLTGGADTHVDHIRPHSGQGDPLFWDCSNLQCLHQWCHAEKTQWEARGVRGSQKLETDRN